MEDYQRPEELRALLSIALGAPGNRRELRRLLSSIGPVQTARVWVKPSEDGLEKALVICEKLSVKACWFSGPGYPESLLPVPDPPGILFHRGAASPGSLTPSVAVIGSRRCSLYGRRTARTLSRELASAGVAVVSGLARGIDAEAHMGALDGGGITVAVLGSGPDIIYPPEHGKLAARIIENGCLISEYPPGAEPARHTFPERNRIISGLSSAVVVVEAGEKSGTMITVGTALDQGRDVLAVPGEISRSSALGSNRLIRDGSGVVLETRDILRAIGVPDPPLAPPPCDDPVLDHIRRRGATAEELSSLFGIPRREILEKLLALELEGLAVRRPGGVYSGM